MHFKKRSWKKRIQQKMWRIPLLFFPLPVFFFFCGDTEGVGAYPSCLWLKAALNESPARCTALHMWAFGDSAPCSRIALKVPFEPPRATRTPSMFCPYQSLNQDSSASQPSPLQTSFFTTSRVRDYVKENWPHSDCSSIILPFLESLLLPPHSKHLISTIVIWFPLILLGNLGAKTSILKHRLKGTFSWANCYLLNSGYRLIQYKVRHIIALQIKA